MKKHLLETALQNLDKKFERLEGKTNKAPTMPLFRVTGLEKWLVKTVYHVRAASPEEAEARCKAGEVAYDERDIYECDSPEEEWLETLSVEQCEEHQDS